MKNLKLLLVFLISILSINAYATHVVGAEFEWEEIGKDTFLIKVNVYRDCNGVNLSATPINVYSNCGTLRLNTTRSNGIDVTPVCDKIDNRCDNKSSSFAFGIERYELSAIFYADSLISNGCCEFDLAWQQCCRPQSITTGGASQNFFVGATLNACQSQDVKWNEPGVEIICLGRDATLDMSLSTSNPNHKVVYSMADPKTSVTGKTTWSSPYSSSDPVYYLGFPKTNQALPRGFHVDKNSGAIQFRPMKEEITVIAVKADIYNGSKLIATVQRDVQLFVVKCPNNSIPTLSGLNGVNSYTKILCTGKKYSFNLYANDQNSKDSIDLIYKGSFGNATIKDSSQAQTFNWTWQPDSTFERADTSLSFSVTAQDNACPFPGKKTNIYRFRVMPKGMSYDLRIDTSFAAKCDGLTFNLRDANNNPLSNVQWFMNDTIRMGKGKTITKKFASDGVYKITALVNGCDTVSFTDTFDLKNVTALDVELKDTALCASDSLILKPKVTGSNGTLKYWWTIDPAFKYKGKVDEPMIKLDLTKIQGSITKPIAVRVEDGSGCKVYKEMTITTKDVKIKDLVSSQTICFGDMETLQLATDSGYGTWYGANVSNNEMNLMGLKPSNYLLVFEYEDDYTCIADTALITYASLPTIDAGGDFGWCVGANDKVLDAKPTGGRWSGNGVTGSNFNAKSAGKGNHELIYAYTDMLGCRNEDTVNVQVFDYVPSISVTDSAEACESDEKIKLTASKNGGTWIGTGVLSTANPFTLNPRDLGSGLYQMVYHYTDSNQCKNSDTSIVRINEAPIINVTVRDSNIAKGDTLRIANNTVSQNNVDYNWSIGNPAFITSTDENFVEVIDSVGTFDLTLIATDKKTGCIDTLILEDAIIVGNGNSVSELDKSINVYPNPVSNVLNIKSDERIESIEIYSLEGKLMSRTTNSNSINVAEFSNGIYLLKVQTVNKIYQTKIYKE
jgi:hypothetical protein